MGNVRIHCTFQSGTKVFERSGPQVVIGRPKPGVDVDLDLSPDDTVSRPHARIFLEADDWWLEDLRSTHGTRVNGVEIRYSGKHKLAANDIVIIGVTTLRIELPAPPPKPDTLPGIEIAGSQDALKPQFPASFPASSQASPGDRQFADRLALLCELPLQISVDRPLDELFETILGSLVKALPGAERAAFLMCDPVSGALLPRAYVSPGGAGPAVSETLARRSLNEGKGFLWLRSQAGDASESILLNRIESGMYAPLLSMGKAIGVLCVDHPHAHTPFSKADLSFLVAVAQYAAMAVTNHSLAEDLRRTVRIQEVLLTNFSPKLRVKLLDRARHGRLRAGGERSEVTILSCDMRGFTRIAAGLDPEDVVDMLNEYLPALASPLMTFDGTIDKFIGDAVLAIFGSPEPDAQQYEKAVRAALAMQAAADGVSKSREKRGLPVCQIGIGIHCGDVVHGFVGSQERMEFTVIGDAVNRASRYCDTAKGGQVLISPDVYRHVHRLVDAREIEVEAKHGEKLRAYLIGGIKDRTTASSG